MTTGWGNDEARRAVRRTLRGGGSGRTAVLGIAAAFLAVGIIGGSLLVSVPFGVATLVAAWWVIRAALDQRAINRMERRLSGDDPGRR